MNYSFFLFNCHLDCCLAENITHEQFKSLLKYDVTLASSSPVVKQCPYDKAEKVYRHCRERFPNSSEWTEVDFSQCKINLKSLNQVGECFNCFFVIIFIIILIVVSIIIIIVIIIVVVIIVFITITVTIMIIVII